MSEKLYYSDPYIQKFTAQISAIKQTDNAVWAALTRTAFYPEGGGQPADHGVLCRANMYWNVIDTQTADDGVVWHRLGDSALPSNPPPQVGDPVTGRINWTRRHDHMQQHCGQHVLSQAFFQIASAETVSFHLGEERCSIDLSVPDLAEAQITAVEVLANQVVSQALPVQVTWVDAAGARRFRLRKPVERETDIRIVAIGDFDHSGCGGTHPGCTAEIGLIKVVGWEKTRSRLRVSFLCGDRAMREYAALLGVVQDVASALSVHWRTAGDAVRALQAQMHTVTEKLTDAEERLTAAQAMELLRNAEHIGAACVIQHCLPDQYGAEEARRLSQLVISQASGQPVVALIHTCGDKPHMVLSRTGRQGDTGPSMVELLRHNIGLAGGRGGGSPLMAQGGVPTKEAATVLMSAVMEQLKSSIALQEGW